MTEGRRNCSVRPARQDQCLPVVRRDGELASRSAPMGSPPMPYGSGAEPLVIPGTTLASARYIRYTRTEYTRVQMTYCAYSNPGFRNAGRTMAPRAVSSLPLAAAESRPARFALWALRGFAAAAVLVIVAELFGLPGVRIGQPGPGPDGVVRASYLGLGGLSLAPSSGGTFPSLRMVPLERSPFGWLLDQGR